MWRSPTIVSLVGSKPTQPNSGSSTASQACEAPSAEVSARVDDAMPKDILSASCGIAPGPGVAYKPFLDQGHTRPEPKTEQGGVPPREPLPPPMGERAVG